VNATGKILAVTVLLVAAMAAQAGDSPSVLLSTGWVDSAVSVLQQRVTASPGDAESYLWLCRAYFAAENWDRAVSACEKAVSLAPNRSEPHLWLGRAYGEKADHSNFLSAAGLARKVRTEFEKAVELDPSSMEARSDLAEFYLEAPSIVGGGQDKARAQAEDMKQKAAG